MSVSEHVSTVISSCAKSIYALRTLRLHAMNSESLYMVYNLLSYRSSQTVKRFQCICVALITRGIRSGLCDADVSTLAEMVDSAENDLFQRILAERNYVNGTTVVSVVCLSVVCDVRAPYSDG